MTAFTLFAALQARGIAATVEGESLHVQPGSALDDELRAEIRKHKAKLMELLNAGPARRALMEATAQQMQPSGLVMVTHELIELWETAELEAGYPLTISGQPRETLMPYTPMLIEENQ